MSQCVNTIILVGFIGATPQFKVTMQGKPVCRFNASTSR